MSVQITGKMCPGRLRIAVDVVGGTLTGYVPLGGAPLLDLCESADRDYYFSGITRAK